MNRAWAIGIVALLAAAACSHDREQPGALARELADSRGGRSRDDAVTELFRLMGKNTIWTQVDAVPMQGWTTFHTEGMVAVGDRFFVSSVETLEAPVRNGVETDALYDFSIDRSTGRGRGWLFEFAADGTLLGQLELTDGDMYHPGGIDYDGEWIWVPMAENRPNSRSRIYRVDPDRLEAELVLEEDDHIGGVVHNLRRGTLHGVSWGSRRMYRWRLHGRERRERRDHGHDSGRWVANPEAYIDYQDCKYRGVEYMLCGGLNSYPTPRGTVAFGGLDLIDLRRDRPEHQIPVNQFVDEGAGPNPDLALTHNAFWVEPLDDRSLRFYFMTESDLQADLLIYDATPWINR
jgi:Family of unknown function (DUF6454)